MNEVRKMNLDTLRIRFGGVGEWTERRWAMQKTKRVASAVVGCGLALGMLSGSARAQQAQQPPSDRPAAILVWPKIVVDTGDVLASSVGPTDTLIQLSSAVRTTNSPTRDLAGLKQAHCFYVDATGHCSNSPDTQ